MQIGKLNQRLIFQKKVKTRDSFGDQLEEWVTEFTVWGAYQPVGSLEFHESWKRFAESDGRFIVRYPLPVLAIIDSANYQVLLIRDFTSPVETTTWMINPPIPMRGEPNYLEIEGNQIL